MKLSTQSIFEDLCGYTSVIPSGNAEVLTDILVCCNPGVDLYPLGGSHNEIRVTAEAIQGLEQLKELIERHSPSFVVFTRASLDRLVGKEGFIATGMSLLGHVEATWPMLSPVNAQLVRLVAKGLRNPEIEQATGMKVRTVRAHLSELYRQFEVTNRTELVGALIERGIFSEADAKDCSGPQIALQQSGRPQKPRVPKRASKGSLIPFDSRQRMNRRGLVSGPQSANG